MLSIEASLLSFNANFIELFYSYQLRALGLFLLGLWLLKLFDTSARCRQAIIKVILLATVLLPFTTLLMPQLQLQVPVSTRDSSSTTGLLQASQDVSFFTPIMNALFISYIAVAFILIIRQITSLLGIWIITRRARRCEHGLWATWLHRIQHTHHIDRAVHIVYSRHAKSPMVWGFFKPTILLPLHADAWEESLVRTTLLHELHHVKRNDWLFHQIMQFVAAIYWINPIAWNLSRQLNDNAETVCDESVVEAGVNNTDYASKLLSVAKHVQQAMYHSAVGMAISHHQSQLSHRIQAILSPEPLLNPSKFQVGVFSLLILVVGLPLFSIKASVETVYIPAPYSVPFLEASIITKDTLEELPTPNTPEALSKVEEAAPSPQRLKAEYLALAASLKHLDQRNDQTSADRRYLHSFKPLVAGVEITAPRSAYQPASRYRQPKPEENHAVRNQSQRSASTITQNPLWKNKRVVKPRYPRNALQRGIEGEVTVQFAVNHEGAVIESKIIEASPKGVFDRHVLRAIQQSSYQPNQEHTSQTTKHYGTEVYKFVIES
ncbi:TonB family protein [Aurantivibrio plasticivorans]